MNEANASFYLPISRTVLTRVLREVVDPLRVLNGLAPHEFASLLFLQAIAGKKPASEKPAGEKLLANLVEACLEQFNTSGPQELLNYAITQLDNVQIQTGFNRLPELKIALLEDSVIAKREFLTKENRWSYEFQKTHGLSLEAFLVSFDNPSRPSIGRPNVLSVEQSRLYRDFESQIDEHMHIQGYAGTGKTTFIRCILSSLENTNAKILILANRTSQLNALKADMAGRDFIEGVIFTNLIRMIVPDELNTAISNKMRAPLEYGAPDSDKELIRVLGVYPSDEHRATVIIGMVRRTLFRYCRSADDELGLQHIPRRVASVLDTAMKHVVCHHATEYWKFILNPPVNEFSPALRGYHKIKWAALNGLCIPEKYTHVVVDESHDIPKSMLQILERSSQARLTLGDVYQNLQGIELNPSNNVRHRELVCSVRSSQSIESIVNPIIYKHPSRTKATFYGNTMHRIEVQYYEKAKVPTSPTVILVSDLWELFEWMQRIANKQFNINLMSTKQNLDWFVKDCIDLYKHGEKASHAELFRFRTWDEVSHHCKDNRSFNRIEKLLEKDYNFEDWTKTAACTIRQNDQQPAHSLALIEDVRNLEFDNVMIAPSITGESLKSYSATFCSTIYVSVTRAKRTLTLPNTLRNHIEHINGQESGKVSGGVSA